jgi:hypothetical protein
MDKGAKSVNRLAQWFAVVTAVLPETSGLLDHCAKHLHTRNGSLAHHSLAAKRA